MLLIQTDQQPLGLFSWRSNGRISLKENIYFDWFVAFVRNLIFILDICRAEQLNSKNREVADFSMCTCMHIKLPMLQCMVSKENNEATYQTPQTDWGNNNCKTMSLFASGKQGMSQNGRCWASLLISTIKDIIFFLLPINIIRG